MRKIKLSLGLVALLAVGAGGAVAHRTGHEIMRAADCAKLAPTERTVCTSCVTRPLKHHYHPDYPPGVRCRPDNGKP